MITKSFLSSLQTTYYYKAYIKDYERECSGIVKSFTTKEPLESIPDHIENSVNYGHGVLIDEVVGGKAVKLYWAPVTIISAVTSVMLPITRSTISAICEEIRLPFIFPKRLCASLQLGLADKSVASY